ncbi:MAG: glycosyltransferase [Elusimicrobia bacterium]|nr:glycosyltransferase [Elusimicrobiota bacterium]
MESKKNMKKILFVSDAGLHSSAFDTQVWFYLRKLKQKNPSIFLVILQQGFLNSKLKLKLEKVKEELGKERVFVFKQFPRVFSFVMKKESLRLRKFLKDISFDVIHAHGTAGSFMAIKAWPQIPVVADLRGVVSEEFRVYGKGLFNKVRVKEFANIEKFVMKNAKFVFCVSKRFKEFLEDKFGNKNIMTVPTLVDCEKFFFSPELRSKFRKKLAIDEKIVFVYSGSVVKWQKPEETALLFSRIKKKKKNAILFFLTPQRKKARKLLSKYINLEDCLIETVPCEEICGYLNAADFALIFRDQNIVNKVASPIKIGEYLLCGLPVIATKGIGDFDENFKEYKLDGINLDKFDFSLLDEEKRFQISRMGRRIYSIQENLPKILSVYERLR